MRLYDDKHFDRILTRDLLNEELVEIHDALSEKADDDLGNISLTDAQKGTVRPALGLGGVTHIEGGATYNNNVITVSTTEVVRGGDGILFAVPSPFGTSATQAVSLEIDGQANSEHPLHDRNGDALHEADLTVNSVYIAISDASSWDILVLPSGDVDLSTYAPLASPALTGTPTSPTPTGSSGDTQIATKQYVDNSASGTPVLDLPGNGETASVGHLYRGEGGHVNDDVYRPLADIVISDSNKPEISLGWEANWSKLSNNLRNIERIFTDIPFGGVSRIHDTPSALSHPRDAAFHYGDIYGGGG